MLPYFSINLGAFLEIFIAPVFIVLVVVTTASVAVIVKFIFIESSDDYNVNNMIAR